jgi:hypothetical protein
MISMLYAAQNNVIQKIEKNSKNDGHANIEWVVASLRDIAKSVDAYSRRDVHYFSDPGMSVGMDGGHYRSFSKVQEKLADVLRVVKDHNLYSNDQFVRETADLLLKCEDSVHGQPCSQNRHGKLGEMIVNEYQSFFKSLALSDQEGFCRLFNQQGREKLIFDFFTLIGQVAATGLNKQQAGPDGVYMGRFGSNGSNDDTEDQSREVFDLNKTPRSGKSEYVTPYRQHYFPNSFQNAQNTR